VHNARHRYVRALELFVQVRRLLASLRRDESHQTGKINELVERLPA
jgi:hypothetical protein